MAVVLWDHWMLLAFVAPVLWAATCVIDVFFVGDQIYRNPSDGSVISGLFSVLPCLAMVHGIGGWDNVTFVTSAPAVIAGICYFLHSDTYFRALFTLNDAAGAETFNTMSVLFVPFLAFAMLGERLAPICYVAISLAVVGVLILIRYHFTGTRRRTIAFLTMSVVCISFAMVLQAWVFQHMDFWNGVILFAAGNFGTAVIVGGIRRERRARIANLCYRYAGVFVAAELLQLIAVVASQGATHLSPSVSLVAVVETSLPLCIMLMSLSLLFVARRFDFMSRDVRHALTLQVSTFPAKMLSLALISIAIVVLQSNAV